MNKMFSNIYTPSHEITPLTLAVISQQDKNKKTTTKIMEEQAEFIVDLVPSKVIDYACKFFGSSLKGRRAGTREVCGITHKAPICIDPTSGMYFFPTASPANPDCSWLAHSHISHMNQTEDHCTEVIFKSGQRIIVEVSYGSMVNQLQRTAQYRYLLDNRINYLQKHRGRHPHKADHVADPPFPPTQK